MMETPEVAIDTSVLVGLIDSQDTWHDAASALQHALKSVQARLVYFDCRPDKLFCQMCRPDPYYCVDQINYFVKCVDLTPIIVKCVDLTLVSS